MENKKIKGATPLTLNHIRFRSKLEASIYKYLLQEGLNPVYEGMTFTLWKGFVPTVPFYDKNGLKMTKLRDITYTPDFTFIYKEKLIIIEVKGRQNDVFPYKFKMFRKILEEDTYKESTILFEVFSLKQMKEYIKLIYRL